MALPSTHTAIAVTQIGTISSIEVPTPRPGPNEVLVKVEYAALIPLDAYATDLGYLAPTFPVILGYTIAGTVAAVGAGVNDLVVGDQVHSFTYTPTTQKATQEYCLQKRNLVAKIPSSVSISLAAASTIPDNFVCAYYTLFNDQQLGLPRPFTLPSVTPPAGAADPILIYGAGTTASQFMIQLLHAAGYSNIISTASPRNHEYIKGIGARAVFDYNSSKMVEDIISYVGGKFKHVVDPIASVESLKIISRLVDENGGRVAVLMPTKKGNVSGVNVKRAEDMTLDVPSGEDNPMPKGVEMVAVRTFYFQKDNYLRDHLMPDVLPRLLASGVIQPTRMRIMDQGTVRERVEAGIDLLRKNKVSGEKVVVKIADATT